MSQLERSDVKTLAACFQFDATLHNADHQQIRFCINHLPVKLQESKLANAFSERRLTPKFCLIHEGIAPQLVFRLFDSLQKEVTESAPLMKRYAFYLGPEENFTLERITAIEGMWSVPGEMKKSPPTPPPKAVRNWDYQVNKCQACMVSRIASNPAALRDLRTILLASIDTTRHVGPSHPTILSFINEWICLSSRMDELFYYSGLQAAAMKEVKLALGTMRSVTADIVDNHTAISPQTLQHSASLPSFQPATSAIAQEHTPEFSSCSYQNANTSRAYTLQHAAYPYEETTHYNIFPHSKNLLATNNNNNNNDQSTQPILPDVSTIESLKGPCNTPDPSIVISRFNLDEHHYQHSHQTHNNDSRVAAPPYSPTASSDDSLTSFTVREHDLPLNNTATLPSPPPPPPPPPTTTTRPKTVRASRSLPNWQDSGISFGFSSSSPSSSSSSSRQHQQQQHNSNHPTAPATTASPQQEEPPRLVSKWSDDTIDFSWDSMWSFAKKKKKSRVPRLGKVTTGKGGVVG